MLIIFFRNIWKNTTELSNTQMSRNDVISFVKFETLSKKLHPSNLTY